MTEMTKEAHDQYLKNLDELNITVGYNWMGEADRPDVQALALFFEEWALAMEVEAVMETVAYGDERETDAILDKAIAIGRKMKIIRALDKWLEYELGEMHIREMSREDFLA